MSGAATVSERVYVYPYHPSSETRPLAVAGSGVTKDQGEDSETSRRKRLLFSHVPPP